MQTIYIGNTLINDIFLGSQRMDDALQQSTMNVEWLLVGGGASGGVFGNTRGGGGGAGRFVSSSLTLSVGTSIPVTIGSGGAARVFGTSDPGQDGGESSIILLGTTYTAPGGGGGGYGINTGLSRNGRNGGSGGGTGGSGGTAGTNTAGSPLAGFGNDGQVGSSGNGGNGGGAGGTPTGRAWVDGITYCVGGSGTSNAAGSTLGSGGGGAAINQNSGAGASGGFIIRYLGSPRATGGTITQSGGYTYHTFTTNGTFTY